MTTITTKETAFFSIKFKHFVLNVENYVCVEGGRIGVICVRSVTVFMSMYPYRTRATKHL